MDRTSDNFVAVTMAVILHVLLFGSMLVAFDWSRPQLITPMAIQATLVTEIPEFVPPVVEKEPEPKPEPVIEEPEPDNSEELRQQAEEEKRQLDALIEKDRLEKIRLQEEADRQKKLREDAERKKREEEDKERKRVEAEQEREADIKRQREENERIRRELEDDQRAEEIEDEERRLAANSSPAMDAYRFAIAQRIRGRWSVPASAGEDTLCTVRVRQIAGGEIVDFTILSCNGDDAVKRSVEAALHRASPLPEPPTPDLFRPILEINLRPEVQY